MDRYLPPGFGAIGIGAAPPLGTGAGAPGKGAALFPGKGAGAPGNGAPVTGPGIGAALFPGKGAALLGPGIGAAPFLVGTGAGAASAVLFCSDAPGYTNNRKIDRQKTMNITWIHTSICW